MFGLFKTTKPINKIKPHVLLVLDGYGLAPASPGNAITLAKKPTMDMLTSNYPNAELIAAGESVGLPANEDGNSEVGHLTIGAGRAINQSLLKINKAIEDGSFYDTKAFISAAEHVKQNRSKLHIMGLAGSGNVHSSVEHLYALMEFCRRQGLKNVKFHLFTDGRDSPPKDGLQLIKSIEERISALGLGNIASICGRYYAMDRDGRWERTKKAYDAIVNGKGQVFSSASEAIQLAYEKGQTDEFVEPTVIKQPNEVTGAVNNNDAVIFYNFRKDRPRQLSMAFIFPNFETMDVSEFGYKPNQGLREDGDTKTTTFQRGNWPENVFFVTMSEYQEKFPVSAVAYPPSEVQNSLAQIISEKNMLQLHVAETEKERMVAFYFDGMKEGAYPGEEYAIIPSPKVKTYDKKPEMSVDKIVKRMIKEIRQDKYHFIVANFANPDMVAHSGDLQATIKAIEHVDSAVGKLLKEIERVDGTLYITADHGNAEELLTFPQTTYYVTTEKGTINTEHSNNPVPFIVYNKKLYGKKGIMKKGSLADVAPTILTQMGLEVPYDMTGTNLLQ